MGNRHFPWGDKEIVDKILAIGTDRHSSEEGNVENVILTMIVGIDTQDKVIEIVNMDCDMPVFLGDSGTVCLGAFIEQCFRSGDAHALDEINAVLGIDVTYYVYADIKDIVNSISGIDIVLDKGEKQLVGIETEDLNGLVSLDADQAAAYLGAKVNLTVEERTERQFRFVKAAVKKVLSLEPKKVLQIFHKASKKFFTNMEKLEILKSVLAIILHWPMTVHKIAL